MTALTIAAPAEVYRRRRAKLAAAIRRPMAVPAGHSRRHSLGGRLATKPRAGVTASGCKHD